MPTVREVKRMTYALQRGQPGRRNSLGKPKIEHHHD
jgi:hypothetical protein